MHLCEIALSFIKSVRESRNSVIFVVGTAMFIDNMLQTVVVPIVPNYLMEITKTSQDNISLPISAEPHSENHEHSENLYIGFLLASKSVVQLCTNPLIGWLTDRLGYKTPMLMGFVVVVLATLGFAFAETYSTLFAARAFQGLGAGCATVAGLGLVAATFPDDEERGQAMGLVMVGLAMGVLIGPPFGGFMYEQFDKSAPFLILAGLALFDGLSLLFFLRTTENVRNEDRLRIFTLLKDPYILVVTGAIVCGNVGIAILEVVLPLRARTNMAASKTEQGIVFLPASGLYLIGSYIFGGSGARIGRWQVIIWGHLVTAISFLTTPFATSVTELMMPCAGVGFGLALIDACALPHLAYLVDLRHSSVYGSIYALGDIAICLAFAVGPAFGGLLSSFFGYSWLILMIALVNILYAPWIFFLKNPPSVKQQKEAPTETRL